MVFLRKFPNNKYQQYQRIDIVERKKRIMELTKVMSDCIDNPKLDQILNQLGELLCKIN